MIFSLSTIVDGIRIYLFIQFVHPTEQTLITVLINKLTKNSTQHLFGQKSSIKPDCYYHVLKLQFWLNRWVSIKSNQCCYYWKISLDPCRKNTRVFINRNVSLCRVLFKGDYLDLRLDMQVDNMIHRLWLW